MQPEHPARATSLSSVPWIVLDVGLAVLALGVLALAGLALWRRVRALTRAVGAAGQSLEAATDRLAQRQSERDAAVAPPAPNGVRRVR